MERVEFDGQCVRLLAADLPASRIAALFQLGADGQAGPGGGADIWLTTTSWLISGRPCQFSVM